MPKTSAPLLKIEDLAVSFYKENQFSSGMLEARAVDGASLTLEAGKTLSLVGESGCGKTMTAYAIMRLVPEPGKISQGTVCFEGKDLNLLSEKEMQRLRGNRISMIFQEPMTALNPVLTIGSQIEEAVLAHFNCPKAELRERTLNLLRQVGIPSPEERYNDYPHQMSGGMRQRIVIAMALINRPSLIIADEPTTALDVTIQRQILGLLSELAHKNGTAALLITHDLGVVREAADEIIVMYAGKIMEQAPTEDLFAAPLHPYTTGLIASIPGLPGENGKEQGKRLPTIPGTVPSLWNRPKGCPFNTRCPKAFGRCFEALPPLAQQGEEAHLVRCWLFTE